MVVVSLLQLEDGDGVVFIDDGDDVTLDEEMGQGVANIGGPLFGLQVLGGRKSVG